MATKQFHEIRDPIHDFVKLDSDERRVLDSGPIQRLRHIHQLAMSYLLYPGATHRRFEHSLGVMELAGRVFDTITADDNIHSSVREVVPEIARGDRRNYWRKVLRMAALCHDIGHLPFSHAAEELLPCNWSHERISAELIQGDELGSILKSMEPPLTPSHVAKIAVGPEKMPGSADFSNWEILLSEIISGDALGVDRIDYLLRDSHHTGVAYGRFDHYRLIDTIRVLPASTEAEEPVLGVESGGIHSAEALLLARYFMFKQVYLHPVRMAYDLHLQQFLRVWLSEGHFPTDANRHQKTNDDEVLSDMARASTDPSSPRHQAADRIVRRKHFRAVYTPTREDNQRYPDPLGATLEGCIKRYGEDSVLVSRYTQHRQAPDFPVLDLEDRVVSSHSISDVLQQIPILDVGIVLVDPEVLEDALKWLQEDREAVLSGA